MLRALARSPCRIPDLTPTSTPSRSGGHRAHGRRATRISPTTPGRVRKASTIWSNWRYGRICRQRARRGMGARRDGRRVGDLRREKWPETWAISRGPRATVSWGRGAEPSEEADDKSPYGGAAGGWAIDTDPLARRCRDAPSLNRRNRALPGRRPRPARSGRITPCAATPAGMIVLDAWLADLAAFRTSRIERPDELVLPAMTTGGHP